MFSCRGLSYGIFRTSRLHMRYVTGELDGILVGDGGYPCLLFLMTPLQNPQTEEGIRYKEIQIRTRQIVERAFGVWKHRFPCLTRGLTTKFLCSTTTVVACAVLHNLALIFNDILVEEDAIENQNEDGEELLGNVENVNGIDGFATREALIVRMFH
ncbi:putative nuclease HARBI1 [Osmia bicornis bicornis]|uniref:putative nuclease HARBI1 n=1 Tax=Osmia bicornis bicornis TaxID=1437191 RepID=UPI001EAF644F|nr:putative nuclease HARBI1 [Osmia bicornis bicornis]